MYVKNNLGPSSSNGLSADVPCSRDSSVEWQAKNFPVKGLNGGCQKDLGNENATKTIQNLKKCSIQHHSTNLPIGVLQFFVYRSVFQLFHDFFLRQIFARTMMTTGWRLEVVTSPFVSPVSSVEATSTPASAWPQAKRAQRLRKFERFKSLRSEKDLRRI